MTFTSMRKLALLLILVVTACAYWPGLNGGFEFDDSINIVQNAKLQITHLSASSLLQAAGSGDSGWLGRPIGTLSFALNYYFTQLDPYWMKLTNLCIHALIGVLLFCLTWQLLVAYRRASDAQLSDERIAWTAMLGMGVWLLHPLCVTSVLYVVQRMAQLSTLFIIAGLLGYTWARNRMCEGLPGRIWCVVSIALCTGLGLLSKENGILLPAFALLVEFHFFKFRGHGPVSYASEAKIDRLYRALLALALLMFAAICLMPPSAISQAYISREFTLSERLLTESRVLWTYIRLIFIPDLSTLGLNHDDIVISKGWTTPITTLPAVLGLGVLFVLSIMAKRRQPWVSFAIMFFMLGHSIESSFIGLEIAHEHRNYLPMMGFIQWFALMATHPASDPHTTRLFRATAGFFMLGMGVLTYQRALDWSNPEALREAEVRHHPLSQRAHSTRGNFYNYLSASSQAEVNRNYSLAYEEFRTASELSGRNTMGLFGLISLNARRKMPIEPEWISALANRLRTFPLSAESGNALKNLQQCVLNDECHLPPAALGELLNAASGNPNAKAVTRGQIAYQMSVYQVVFQHDKQAGAKWAMVALEQYGSNRANVIAVATQLIACNQLEQARQILDTYVAQHPVATNIGNEDISQLKDYIERLRKNPSMIDVQIK